MYVTYLLHLISSRLHYRLLLLLIAITALLYLSSLSNEYVSFDDHFLVRDNDQVQNFDPSILWTYDPELYVPLTLFTYQIDYVVFGGSAFVVHLTNLILHIITSCFVFFFLRRFSFDDMLAFLGALIFAVHPFQVESVAWASGRKEILYTLFFLLSVLLYMRKDVYKSQVAFLFSLLSKVTALTLPIVLLGIDWLQHRKLRMQMLLSKWMYLLCSFLFAGIALFGKQSDVVLSFWEMILLSLRTIIFFLIRFFVPTGLTIIHPITETIRLGNIEYLLPTGLCFLLLITVRIFRKRVPKLLFGFFLFATTLSPSFLGYAKAGQIQLASEHYMYLPIIGLILVVLSIVEHSKAKIAYCVLSLWIAVLMGTSFQRLQDWRNSEALYLRVLDVYPTSHMAASNLAAVYLEEDREDDAIAYLKKALEWKPNYASAYVNLAEALRRKGDFSGAQKASLKALKLNPAIEDIYAKDTIGIADLDESINQLLKAIDIDPVHADLWWRLGGLYGQKEMYKEGIRAFQKAASLDPSRREQAEELEEILKRL